MLRRLSFIILPFALLILSGCAPDKAPEVPKEPKGPVDALFEKMIAEYGGVENLKKLNSYISTWEMQVQLRPQTGKAVVKVALPHKLRVELIYTRNSETRVLNGIRGYKGYNKKTKKEIGGPMLDAMKLQLLRLYTPLELEKRRDSLKFTEADGFKLIMLKQGNLTSTYFVNPSTHRIEKVVGALNMKGQKMEFQTEYSDFKMVEGVLMHHKENKFAGGTNTAILFLKELKLNATHKKSVFRRR